MIKWIYDVSTDTTVDFNEIKAVRGDEVLIDGVWIKLSNDAINEIDARIGAKKEVGNENDNKGKKAKDELEEFMSNK